MAKSKIEIYSPSQEELNSMLVCNRNDLAYIIQPIKNSKKYNIIKFQISNYLEVFTLKENDVKLEFNEYDGLKKVMELYTQHSKRLSK